MHYFTEDVKIKELKAIFEAMETSSVVDEPEVISDPLQASQDTVDAERKRRELANAAIKKGEKSVVKTDFGSKKADLEAQIAKKDFAINFLTKQMEVTQDPEDKQGFADLIQDKVNEKNALLTQVMHVSDQAGTQASISSGNDEEVVTEADAPLDLNAFDTNNLQDEDDATLIKIIHQVYGDQVDVTGIQRNDLISLAADALGEVSHHQNQAQADNVIDQHHGLDEEVQ